MTLGRREAETISHFFSLCKNSVKNQGGLNLASEVMREFSFDDKETEAKDKLDAFYK